MAKANFCRAIPCSSTTIVSSPNGKEILGLISLVDCPEEYRIHLNLIEVGSKNRGKDKEVENIAGCLIAFACQIAFDKDYFGFVSLKPKTRLIDLYQDKYGFRQYGRLLAVEQRSSISLINKFTCESKFIDYLPEFIDNKEVTNAKKMNDRFNQLPSYFGIYYDKYRNVYYRPVKHENKTKNKFGSQNVNEFKYSIMILDENFKVVGEQIFDSKDHLMYYIIITKSGILLKSPDDLSGKTRFTLFTLNENN